MNIHLKILFFIYLFILFYFWRIRKKRERERKTKTRTKNYIFPSSHSSIPTMRESPQIAIQNDDEENVYILN